MTAPDLTSADPSSALRAPATSIPLEELGGPALQSAEATSSTLTFALDGLTCASCVSAVERALRGVDGVLQASVSLPLLRAQVHVQPRVAPQQVAAAAEAAVARAGFQARRQGGAEGSDDGDEAGAYLEREAAAARRRLGHVTAARRRFLLALTGSAPLVLLHLLEPFGLSVPAGLAAWTGWVQLALCTAVLAAGAPIFRAAAQRARHLGASMDTLVALGTLAAYGASAYALPWGATNGAAHGVGHTGGVHLHFGAAAMIVSLVLLGRFLEARAQGRTGEALRGLLDLAPPVALRLSPSGEALEVPLREVRAGDRLRVLPGAAIPTDGVVLVGRSAVSEALLTGESAPTLKGPGEAVIGGTVNGEAPLVIRAERVGAETQLARIVRGVAEAQGSKAGVERLADRVSAVFVPLILLIAAATGAGWAASGSSADQALLAAVAVLVVACPCALGLATPTAVVVAVGRAAGAGLLVREVRALEALAGVTHVLFDKTGTLTTGTFQVRAVRSAPGVDEALLLALAAAVEAQSEHPLARGIVAEAARRGAPSLPALEVQVEPGGGVRGLVAGKRVRAGSRAWLAREGVALAAEPDPLSLEPGEPGASEVAVAREDTFLGTLTLADAPRETSPAAIARLLALGVTPVLLSGDRREVADAVARRLGIEHVIAEVRPEGKLAEVQRLRAGGARVAMVGDGLNDAPALAGADVGLAMGQGTDVAKEAADITLLRDDPTLVPAAVALARRTLQVVRQNLWWAFGYNLVAIPLAVTGQLHPAAAAAFMALSSVLVVTNSLRLRRAPT